MANIPHEFKTSEGKSFNGVKVEVSQPAEGVTTVTSNNTELRFKIPRHRGTSLHLNGNKIRLKFTASFTGGVTTTAANNIIKSIFERSQVFVGSRLIDESREDGFFSVISHNLTRTKDYNSIVGSICEGVGDAAKRQAQADSYTYVVELRHMGFLDRILPTWKMAQIDIVLRLNSQPGSTLEVTGGVVGSPLVSLTNNNLLLQYIDSQELKAMYSGVVVGDFVSYINYQNTIPAGASNITLNIPVTKVRSMKGLLSVMREQTNGAGDSLNNPARLDKMESFVNGTSEWYYKVNTMTVPRDRVDTTDVSVPLRYLQDWVWSHFHTQLDSEWLDENYLTNKFIIAYDLSASPGLISGLDTKSNNSDLTLTINFDTPPTQLLQVDSWISYDTKYQINGNGSLQILF